MMTTSMISPATPSDSALVSESLAGNRDAFGQIVERYQSLVCSLAYSATGSLSQSEDLAQDTFVTAWRQLSDLREPEKLRAWLCGIARNLIKNSLRKQGREPSHAAQPLDEISESRSLEPPPAEQTITNEEQAILWRSLECIPEIYREPLVLFYREYQSIEAVAEKLELTEDNARQRLSRGRKLLHEQVLAFVEGALEKTSPGKSFTLGVLGALPLTTATAKAAAVGSALAKGGVAAKGVLTAGTAGGFLAMLGGAYITFMAHADDSKSPRERQFLFQNFGKRMLLGLLVGAGLLAVAKLSFFQEPTHLLYLIAGLGYFLAIHSSVILPRHTRRRQQIQIEDGTFDEAEWTKARKVTEPAGPNDKLRMLKFMALGIGLLVFVITQESWKQDPRHAVLITTYMVAAVFWGFLRWKNRPRFQSLRGFVIGFPIFMALMTLAFFNWQQYLARLGGDVSRMMPAGQMVAFNLIVALAYAVLIGVLIWKRKSANSPAAKT